MAPIKQELRSTRILMAKATAEGKIFNTFRGVSFLTIHATCC
jgi:hypothetical protein